MTTSERWGGFSKVPVGRAASPVVLVLLALGALAFTAAMLAVVPW